MIDATKLKNMQKDIIENNVGFYLDTIEKLLIEYCKENPFANEFEIDMENLLPKNQKIGIKDTINGISQSLFEKGYYCIWINTTLKISW